MSHKATTEPIKTILVITIGFLVLYRLTGNTWMFYTAVIIGVLGLLSGTLARYIDTAWMGLARILGLIVPNILLSAVFFLLLTPIALLSRLFQKKDKLHLRNNSSSLFENHNRPFHPASFERPW
ncbi:MAG TPA: SxtJ family membrane protein [Lacibacter sp.]|nr:SxtJ family membrane protein [Lacibacter sp.]HMO89247.1 SxtJ family membrane protein [Lacibacter sp.]HMP86644.1 SxtJ family membrane protein [Lacibacter sp.]